MARASGPAYDAAGVQHVQTQTGPPAELFHKAAYATSLLDLPASTLSQVSGSLLPITQRQLRLTCKQLKQAVDGQVTRLVIDSPAVDPAPFPGLRDITVVLWRAGTDECDLLPLLCQLPRMHQLRCLRIKAGPDAVTSGGRLMSAASAGGGGGGGEGALVPASAVLPAWKVLGRCVSADLQVAPAVCEEPPSLARDTLQTMMALLARCPHSSSPTYWCSKGCSSGRTGPVRVLLDTQVVCDGLNSIDGDTVDTCTSVQKELVARLRQELQQAARQQRPCSMTDSTSPTCQLYLHRPVKVSMSQDMAGLLHSYTGLTELRLDLPAALSPQPTPPAPLGAAPPPRPPTPGFDLRPLAALTSLQKLRLNWMRPGPAPRSVVTDNTPRPEGLEGLTKGLAKSLTSFELLGMIQLKVADLEYVGYLTGLTTLTLWHEGWVTGAGLEALSTCTALTQLQVARLDLYAGMPDPPVPLPQVKELSAHTMQGAPLLRDALPGLAQATLHDWPGTCSPGILTGLTDMEDKDKAAASLKKLVMVQYTSSLHTVAWGNLSRRISANLKGVAQLHDLQSISFYHFTHLNTVRQLCQVASQLPCLNQLTLVASATETVSGTERVANTFGGLTQLRSLTIDCEGCNWDVMADLLLIKPPCRKGSSESSPAPMWLSALWLASLGHPVSHKQMAALVARLPQLAHIELVGCKGVTHQMLMLPQQLGKPELHCVVHSAPVHDVAPGMRGDAGIGHVKSGVGLGAAGSLGRAMQRVQAAVVRCKERLGLQPMRF